MFSALRRMTGMIDVKEQGRYIHISGMPGTMVQDDIARVWASRKLGTQMFTHIGQSDLTFDRWFAPDVVTAFNKVLATNNNAYQLRAMRKVVEQLYERTWLKMTLQDYPDILDRGALNQMNVTLLEHQEEFLTTYNKFKPKMGLTGYLLGAPPGSGKTILTIATMLCRHRDQVVICCPKNAVNEVWTSTLNMRMRRKVSMWTSLDGTMPKPGLRYYILHYDAFERFMAACAHFVWRNVGVGLDESHKLNEFDTHRTQLFIRMCTEMLGSEDTIWASGTPIKAVGAEATPIFSTIDPLFDNPDLQKRFRAIYTANAGQANIILNSRLGKMHFTIPQERFRPEKPDIISKKVIIPNGEEYTLTAIRQEMRAFIEERIAFYQKNMRSYRNRFHEILDQFEKGIEDKETARKMKLYRKYVRLISETSNLQEIKDEMAFCNDFEKKVIIPALSAQDKKDFKDAKSVVKYYLLKVQGEALGSVLGAKRAKCIADMVEHANLSKYIDHSLSKTLIFTSYVSVVNTAAAYLKKEGYQPLRVFGETNKDLSKMVDLFRKDENANPMIATYKSLAEAVPITMASTLITLNDPFRDYEMSQAKARIDRLGQPLPVTIYHLYLDTGEEPNISTRSRVILEWSRQQVQEILGVDVQDGMIMEDLDETREAISMEAFLTPGSEAQYPDVIDWCNVDYEALFIPGVSLNKTFSW